MLEVLQCREIQAKNKVLHGDDANAPNSLNDAFLEIQSPLGRACLAYQRLGGPTLCAAHFALLREVRASNLLLNNGIHAN